MKVLVTGFDPFGGDKVNPAYEAVKKMPDEISGAEIIKVEVPTVFEKSSQVVKEAIQQHQPDVVICVGQAGGRSAVSFERVAINLAEARIPDNEGNQPFDTALEENGPAAYFTSLPIKAMTKNVQDHGLPAYISYTAGTFVCNDIMDRNTIPGNSRWVHPRAILTRSSDRSSSGYAFYVFRRHCFFFDLCS